ncbi:MAG: O-antigen ligase family protein [Bacteroidia bacterium]|nr:O-antigen ligase family protein [Bacteroidia bacterium]
MKRIIAYAQAILQDARLAEGLYGLWLLGLSLSKGLASTAMVLLLLLTGYHWLRERRLPGRLPWLPVVLWLCYALSLLWTSDLRSGWRTLWIQNVMLFIPVITAGCTPLLRSRLEALTGWLLAGALLSALATLALYAMPEEQVRQLAESWSALKRYHNTHDRTQFGLYTPFAHRLQFANVLLVSVLGALWLWSAAPRRRWWLLPAILVLALTQLLLGGRGAQLAMLAGGAVWLTLQYLRVLHPRISRRAGKAASWMLLAALLLLGGLAAPWLAYRHVPAVTKRYDQLRFEVQLYANGRMQEFNYREFTVVRRILFYRNAWTLAADKPLGGAGIGDYEADMQSIYARDGLGFPVNSHNQILYAWAAAGLPAGLATAAILLAGLLAGLRNPDPGRRAFLTAIAAALWVLVWIDAIYKAQPDAMLFIMVFGWAAATAGGGLTSAQSKH